MTYTLPELDPYRDWTCHESRDFKPNARQQIVIESVRRALAQGLFYNTDVRAFCASDLAISEDVDKCKRERVEGGTFGSDLYYARRYLDAVALHEKQDAAVAELSLKAGQKLPALMFGDYKLIRAVFVETVSESGRVVAIRGSRGTSKVRAESLTPLQVKYAIERAEKWSKRREGHTA